MNTVPNIISTKDLAYLEDMFNWNMNASKKAFHFEKEVQDMDVKNILGECAKMHASICQKIIELLKKGEDENEQQ